VYSFFQPPVISSVLGPNILLGSLFANTIKLCSSPSETDHISPPYKTTGKTAQILMNDSMTRKYTLGL